MDKQTIDEQLAVILQQCIEHDATDVHLSPGEAIHFRIDGILRSDLSHSTEDGVLDSATAETIAGTLLTEPQLNQLHLRFLHHRGKTSPVAWIQSYVTVPSGQSVAANRRQVMRSNSLLSEQG